LTIFALSGILKKQVVLGCGRSPIWNIIKQVEHKGPEMMENDKIIRGRDSNL